MRRHASLVLGAAAICIAVETGCKSEHDPAATWPAPETVDSTAALPMPSVPPSADDTSNVGAPIPDTRLTSAIVESFEREPALRTQHVHVSVTHGAVMLGGTVPTLAAKWRAAKLVDDFKGASSIIDDLRVSTAARRDTEIAGEVGDALKSDPATRKAKVAASLNQGKVTLRATVDSFSQRELLRHAVSRARRVQARDLAVTIVRPSPRSDVQLVADLTDRLHDDARLDGTRLAVDVRGRDATLSGILGSLMQRDAAAEDAGVAWAATVDTRRVRIDWRQSPPALVGAERPPLSANHEADAVRRALASDERLGGQLPTVSADLGVATITGNVIDFRAKKAAVGDARRVSGVSPIDDQMTVLPAKVESDATIQRQLTWAMYNDEAIPTRATCGS